MQSLRLFGFYIRTPYLLFWLTELVVCAAAVQVAALVRFGGHPQSLTTYLPQLLPASLVFSAIMTVSLIAFGLYQSQFRGGALGVLMRIALGFIGGSVVLSVVFYLFPETYMGRGVTAIAMAIAFFSIGTIRPLFLPIVEQETLKRRVGVLGSGERAAMIDARLRRRADRRGFAVVAYLDYGDRPPLVDPVAVRAPPAELVAWCERHRIDDLVVALDEQRSALPTAELVQCRMAGVSVMELHALFEREAGFLPLELVRPSWFIYAEGFRFSRSQEIAKRAVDLCAALLLLLVSWPVMVLSALAIAIECRFRDPVFYVQERVGLGGRPFGVIKFRSMAVDAEGDGQARWATRNDSRVTAVGEVIRTLRIDELPQIINVLRGDMSLVGPRPERPVFVEELEAKVPYYRERHQVKPGLTGWAQISYPYGASDRDARAKHEFDLYYVKNHTLFLDVFIMLQTIEVVLLGKGAR